MSGSKYFSFTSRKGLQHSFISTTEENSTFLPMYLVWVEHLSRLSSFIEVPLRTQRKTKVPVFPSLGSLGPSGPLFRSRRPKDNLTCPNLEGRSTFGRLEGPGSPVPGPIKIGGTLNRGSKTKIGSKTVLVTM